MKQWWNNLPIIFFAPSDAGGGGGAGAGGTGGSDAPAGGSGGGGGAADAGGAAAAGGAAPSFKDSLPEDLREHPSLRDYVDVAGLAKSHVHLSKLLGAPKDSVLAIPPEGASDEDRAKFYNRLGRPEKADGYKLPEVKLAEGVTENDQFKQNFLSAAHKAGLSNAQVGALYQWYTEQTNESVNQIAAVQQASLQQTEQTLQREWGAAYNEKIALSQRAVREYADPDTIEYLEKSGFGNDAAVIKLFAKLGEQLKEDGKLVGEGLEAGKGALSPKGAQEEINKKYGDGDFMKAYSDKSHPNHAGAVAEMDRLFKFAYPVT